MPAKKKEITVTRKKKEKEVVTVGPEPGSGVDEYANSVVNGTELAGPHVRAACQRHISDRQRRDIKWVGEAAQHIISYYADVLRLSGTHEGQPFILHPSQQFIVGSLFGWKRLNDMRRFETAYVEEAKGNGKSPLAAGVGLYMMTAVKEPRAEIYSAAVDKDQAKILFRDAVAMVDQSPALSRRITKSGGKDGDWTKVWNLAYLETGSFFRPISSENHGRGKSGFRPFCVLLDEIHEHPTDAMVEFTRKNVKGRPGALVLMITNSGVNDPGSVCLRYHNYAVDVAAGKRKDDAFFSYVCGLDVGDDWKDPNVWKKASPMLDVSVPSSYLENEVIQSLGMPARQNLTRRLNFCEWVDTASPFVDADIWRANGDRPEYAENMACVGGLDLSNKNDLTAFVLRFANGAIVPYFWTPEEGLRQREDRDQAPYSQWVREGFLKAVPGTIIDYKWVARQIGDIKKRYDLIAVAFDRWGIDRFQKDMEEVGVDFNLVPHGQGFQDMSPSIQALEDDLMTRQLRHNNHALLTWCMNNAQVEMDPSGNRKFTKRKSTGRIDGAVALAMASGLYSQNPVSADPQFFVLG